MFIFFNILFTLLLKPFIFFRDNIQFDIFIMEIYITFQIIFLIINQVEITRFLNFNIFYWHVKARCVWVIIRMIVKIQSYQLIPWIYIEILKWCSLFLSLVISWVVILYLFYVKYLYLLNIRRLYFSFFVLNIFFVFFILNKILSLVNGFFSDLVDLYLFLNVFVYL